jgi:hypothetical protein
MLLRISLIPAVLSVNAHWLDGACCGANLFLNVPASTRATSEARLKDGFAHRGPASGFIFKNNIHWHDLAGFGWIWLDLAGFGWIWLDSAVWKIRVWEPSWAWWMKSWRRAADSRK